MELKICQESHVVLNHRHSENGWMVEKEEEDGGGVRNVLAKVGRGLNKNALRD